MRQNTFRRCTNKLIIIQDLKFIINLSLCVPCFILACLIYLRFVHNNKNNKIKINNRKKEKENIG